MPSVNASSHPHRLFTTLAITLLSAAVFVNGARPTMPPSTKDFVGIRTEDGNGGAPDMVCLAVSRDSGPVRYESSQDYYESYIFHKSYRLQKSIAAGYAYTNPYTAHNTFVALRKEKGLAIPTHEQLRECLNKTDEWQEVLLSGMVSISTTSVSGAQTFIDYARDELEFTDEEESDTSRRPNLVAGGASSLRPSHLIFSASLGLLMYGVARGF